MGTTTGMRIRLKHDRLAELLSESRLSQNHWAMRLGLSRGHLSDLLKGRHPYVSDKTRAKLLEGLGVSFDDLFEVERPRPRHIQPPEPRVAPVIRPSLRQPSGAAMLTLFEDLRYALRVAARYRLVTGAVVATMALGIAVTTSVYSIVQTILLSPLPFPESDRVVRLGMTLRDGRIVTNNALPDIEDYRKHSKSISDISAVQLSGTTITAGDTPAHEMVAYVDHGYDEVFRLQLLHGRFFQPGEHVFGAPRVTLISNRLWRQRFNGDPAVVGQTISLDHQPVTIVGVLPPMPYMYPWPDLGFIAPLRPNPKSFHFNRGALWLRAVARMRPGVDVSDAQQEIGSIAAGIAERFPDSNAGLKVRVEGLRAAETQDARAMLVLMSAAVATVLLIACVNIANLLLGHSRMRMREFAVRAALGGRSGRLRRQILTESLALSAVGGVIGIMLAPMIVRAIVALYPGRLARLEEITFDWRVAVIGLGVTAIAGLLAGLPTARRAAGLNLVRDLRHGGRSATEGRGFAGRVLIGSQVALSLALLFASVLLVQTLRTLTSTDPGFETTSVLTFHVSAPAARYPDAADIERYFSRVEEAIRVLPGVTGVATSSQMPYTGNRASDVFIMKERGDLGRDNPQVRLAMVSPAFWSVLGAPIKSGRGFTARDDATAPPVVVVNEALVDRYYPGQNPVGRRIEFNRQDWEIVGVAGAMRMASVAAPPEPELYFPAAQNTRSARYVMVRSPAVAVEDVRRVMRDVDPTIALTEVATLEDRIERATAPERFRAVLFSCLGIIALLLSSLGIYGVLADSVSQRTREIGIRMALGEGQGAVKRAVVKSAFRPVLAGAVVGVGLAAAAAQWLARFLVGVDPWNVPALVATIAVLCSVAFAAAYIPARRASRVDPLTALRQD
jgi:putative ABC transport system permease protein